MTLASASSAEKPAEKPQGDGIVQRVHEAWRESSAGAGAPQEIGLGLSLAVQRKRAAEMHGAEDRHRQHFAFGQDTVEIIDINRHQFEPRRRRAR